MKREIKFRGKSPSGIWLYGDLSHRVDDGIAMIYIYDDISAKGGAVIPETVGQFTGLTDSKGKEIYEGDIIEGKSGNRHLVKYDEGSAAFLALTLPYSDYDNGCHIENDWLIQYEKEVIGNVYDNPELIKKEA